VYCSHTYRAGRLIATSRVVESRSTPVTEHFDVESAADPNDVEVGATTAAVADRGRAFAAGLRDCVALLPDAVDAVDDPETLASTVDRADHLESRCDELAREIRRLLSNGLAPSFAGAYLVADDLATVVTRSDAVASRAEAFVAELAAVEPSLTRTERVDLRTMAGLAVEATTVYSRALDAYLLRIATGESVDVDYSLDRVHAIESDCDDRKYAFVDRAFDDRDTAAALVQKDLATSLDDVANAAEDAADELLAVASLDVEE
jgi:uncharacterized protein Yka (UPF0111/DUF47 family)